MKFSEKYSSLLALVEEHLATLALPERPAEVYEPMRYVLSGGGKRVRPVLTLLAAESIGGTWQQAMPAALAIEILHNFTLVHDDIMDSAALRRGRATVHKKWNVNTAILSGDTMMGVVFQQLLQSKNSSAFPALIETFTTGLVEVCEGQALDLSLEHASHPTVAEYIEMISKKTASLLTVAAVSGALACNAKPEYISALHDFALSLGIAFQIQDDVLDITADSSVLGKTSGGDIVEGKRTYLIVTAVEQCSAPDDKALLSEFFDNGGLPLERVPEMRNLFERNNLFTNAEQAIQHYTNTALQALQVLPHTQELTAFAQALLQRSF